MNQFPDKESYHYCRLGEVLPVGWMKQQMKNDLQVGFAGYLDALTFHASSAAFTTGRVRSYEVTPAGMIHDTTRTWWNGETEAVWLDGLVRMAYLSGEEAAVQKADRLMTDLLASQDDTGYIGIYKEDCRYKHKKENGEFWTQSRACIAMLAYYELTGKETFLNAVVKVVGLTMQHYGPHRSYFKNEEPAGGTGHGLMVVDVLEWLFRLTKDHTFKDYGIWCYEDYCSAKSIRDVDNHVDRLLRLHEGFHWHTPHTTEHLRVPLWVSYVSGDPQYKQAAENAYAKIQRYLVPSGACIGDERIKDRQPTADMPYEYCAITELLTSLQSAYHKTGDTLWGDMAEWLVFNAAQAARLPDGKGVSYLTRDNRLEATDKEHGGRLKLSPTHEDVAVCCNPNAVKLLPYYASRMWLRLADGAGVCAFCYGPSELHTTIAGKVVTIQEETDYPFSEEIIFRIQADEPITFELRLRVPGWASDYDMLAHGADIKKSASFCRIRKEWKTGDQVKITFHCSVEPFRTENGEIAIRRGPLLYALPIPETRKILKEYDVAGEFTDFSAIPIKPPQKLQIDLDNLAFNLKHNAEANYQQPWHQSPLVLQTCLRGHGGVKCQAMLVPIGCTLLRQTSFTEYPKAQQSHASDTL